jgi:hypothetical protein
MQGITFHSTARVFLPAVSPLPPLLDQSEYCITWEVWKIGYSRRMTIVLQYPRVVIMHSPAWQPICEDLNTMPKWDSVVLTNAEVRVPVFQYLSRQKIRSSLSEYSGGGFIDAGTAWRPFRSGNPSTHRAHQPTNGEYYSQFTAIH